jgi:amino acid transporter
MFSKVSLRYGIGAALLPTILGAVYFWFGPEEPDYGVAEIFGWAGILLGISMVPLAILSYRRKQEENELSFGQAFQVGMGVVLIGSIAMIIWAWIFMTFMQPDFFEQYSAWMEESKRASLSAEEFAVWSEKAAKYQEGIYVTTGFQLVLSFMNVFIPGLIVNLISSYFLRRNPE